jgi:hypothetical protein
MLLKLSRFSLLIAAAIALGGVAPVLLYWLAIGPLPTVTPERFVPIPMIEQLASFISGFVIKTIYMSIALVIVAVLWRRKAPDLVALKWGFLFFYLGEAFCALNYILFGERSVLFENLHSYGMVLSFAFVTWAIFEGMGRRLIRFSDPARKCAAVELCGPCAKHVPEAPCGLKRLFLWLTPSAGVLTAVPLSATPKAVSYNTTILGTEYNHAHLVVHQLYEIRFLPLVALALFSAAFVVLLMKKENAVAPAKLLFSAGMGALGFSLFRLFLFAPFQEHLAWFIVWEEVTEFLFALGALLALWFFRKGLFSSAA